MRNNIPTVLITGSNGQLGSELKLAAGHHQDLRFIFASSHDLAIDDFNAVAAFFSENKPTYCINCAAYTAVDKAETEPEKANLVNAEAVANLARLCNTHGCQLIHISTDYVFDGTATSPYKETDKTRPVGAYGRSKCKGEEMALRHDPTAIIIRTSWLYSSFGNNFVKTMMRLMKDKASINVVNDQYGCPTYAADLAEALLQIINSDVKVPGIYHYANAGSTTWYQFALAIRELMGSSCMINPIPTSGYPTPAKRPAYSVLDTTKLRTTYAISIPQWKESLRNCIRLLQ